MKLGLSGKGKLCIPQEIREHLKWKSDSQITLYHNLNKKRIEFAKPDEDSNDCYMFYNKTLKDGAFTMPEQIRNESGEYFVVMNAKGNVFIYFEDVKVFA